MLPTYSEGEYQENSCLKIWQIQFATVGAGTGGWVAGAAIGSAIPGIGTIVGGLVGSMVAGSAAGKSNKCCGWKLY